MLVDNVFFISSPLKILSHTQMKMKGFQSQLGISANTRAAAKLISFVLVYSIFLCSEYHFYQPTYNFLPGVTSYWSHHCNIHKKGTFWTLGEFDSYTSDNVVSQEQYFIILIVQTIVTSSNI